MLTKTILSLAIAGCVPTTVRVCGTNGWCGVGYIDEDKVVTAAHNLKIPAYIETASWDYLNPEILSVDEYADVAVLSSFMPGRSIEYGEATGGEAVVVHVRLSRTVKRRYKGTVVCVSSSSKYYVAGYDVDYGHSGSPVTTTDGRVIGIVVSMKGGIAIVSKVSR